jgi:hypothetical protein
VDQKEKEFTGGYWWKDSGDCPKCHALVLVEEECEFRVSDKEEYDGVCQ